MSFTDFKAREINFKVVYYGPALSGRTTNLVYIHSRIRPERRGRLFSLELESDRTLFFDCMPKTLGTIGELRPRFHLYTMPGVVFSDTSRRQVLKGADGVVFVADSQDARHEANVQSLADLEVGMAAHGLDLRATPLVMQYNKRDMPNAMPVAELDELLATIPCSRFEAIASTGVGVFDTLKAVARAIVGRHRAESGDTPTG